MNSRLNASRLNYLLNLAEELSIQFPSLSNASSTAMFWQAAFQSENAADFFALATQHGIHPTADEMNEPHDEFGNAWLICISSNHQGIIKQLLANNILPTTEALNAGSHGFSGWHLLARTDETAELFTIILSHDVWPSAEVMNAYSSEVNISVWYRLACSIKRVEIFHKLITNGVSPSVEALNAIEPQSNVSTWFHLAGRGSTLSALFSLGLYPNLKVMRAISSVSGISCWFAFAQQSMTFNAFTTLHKQNVCFTTQDLHALNGFENSISIWQLLFKKVDTWSVYFIEILLNANEYPRADIIDPDTWFELFKCSTSALRDTNKIIASLFRKGIYPTVAAMRYVSDKDNISIWHLLANSNIIFFNELLAKGIIPSAKVLNLMRPDGPSVWHILARRKRGATIYKLIKMGILPDEVVMNAEPEHQAKLGDCTVIQPSSVWKLLSIYRDECYRDIINILDEKNILQYDSDDARRLLISRLEITTPIIKKLNPMAVLLTRNDIAKYYGFICFLYTLAERKIKHAGLPAYDIILLLAQNILPASKKLTKDDIFSERSRDVFMRYHAIQELGAYMRGSLFSIKHKDRATFLLNDVKTTTDIRETIMWQCDMMLAPGRSPYPQDSTAKHEKPYSKSMQNDKDEDYKNMMADLYRVARGRRKP